VNVADAHIFDYTWRWFDADRMRAMSNRLKEVMKRAESWPEPEQEELADLLLAIEAERANPVVLSDDDVAALERGAEDIRLGRIASDESVKEILDRYR
jgi:hypothetical protein